MKFVCVLFILMSLSFDFVMPVDPKCSYEYGSWNVVGRTYHCDVRNILNIISSESAVITGETGSHDGSKNNDDVHGFNAEGKKIEIFPRGLEKIYKNLKLIIIRYGCIKEIHQSDLKPFSQLEFLDLEFNNIEVLEEGLFDFNPNLGFISFYNNKISQINPNVFDHLTKLTYLWLHGNQCIKKNVDDNSSKVKELIKEVKLQCPTSFEYKEVQKLKLNFNDQNLKFTEKLTKVENTCQNSFLELSPKISSLEATSKDLLTRVENTAASLSASNKAMESRLELKQASDVQALNSKIQEIETSNLNKMKQNMQSVSRAMAFQNKAFNDKIDKLEKALNTTDTNLQNLKSEMFAAFGKLLEKLEENAAKIERRTAPKMEAIMTTLKSQNLAFADLNKKMINLETGLATLQSELMDGKNNAQSSCGLDLDED